MTYLEPARWDALMEGFVRGKYQFLLGSGFSRDVIDRAGVRLPSGDQMRDELLSEFGITISEDEVVNLSRAYSAARRRNPEQLRDWIRRRFTNTSPPDWFSLFCDLEAEAVWTMNIDDALQQAAPDRYMTHTFSDKHRTPPQGKIPLIHLHGLASRSDDGLIFTLDEYREYVTNPRAYALQFQEALSGGPIVVLGAALHHEFDLARALRERASNPDGLYPSVLVKPNPTELEIEEFVEYHIEVVDATAESFCRAVRDGMSAAQIRLAPALASEASNSPSLLRFAQQWDRFDPTQGSRTRYRDFLSGAEPVANDVRKGDVVGRTIAGSILSELTEGQRPVLVHGIPFTGKSTLLKAISTEFHARGWHVFNFSGTDRLDAAAVVHQMKASPNTLLVIDDAGLFANDVRELLDRSDDAGVAIHLLAADRTGPASRLLRWEKFHEARLANSLNDMELLAFIELLRSRDRLNAAWRDVPAKRVFQKLRASGWRDFTSIICELVLGETFEQRVRSDYFALKDDLARDCYLLGCVLARVTGGASIGLVAQALETTPRRVELRIQDLGSLDSLCVLQNGKVRPRHRRHAEIFLESILNPENAFEPLVGLARAVAPHLDVFAIRRGTAPYRISVRLLDQEELASIIGGDRLEDFYREIETSYSWNSRYWEQRALAASGQRQFPAAVDFSRKAIAAHRDAFSLNTYASVCFAQIRDSSDDDDQKFARFRKIFVAIREARDISRKDSEYPYVTFLTAALRLGQSFKGNGKEIPEELAVEIDTWIGLGSRSEAFRDEIGQRKLLEFKKRWLAVGR